MENQSRQVSCLFNMLICMNSASSVYSVHMDGTVLCQCAKGMNK